MVDCSYQVVNTNTENHWIVSAAASRQTEKRCYSITCGTCVLAGARAAGETLRYLSKREAGELSWI